MLPSLVRIPADVSKIRIKQTAVRLSSRLYSSIAGTIGRETFGDWFDVAHVLGREGPDWQLFKARLANATGIPLAL